MAAIAFSAEPHNGWTIGRTTAVVSLALLVFVLARRRRAVLGCAFALVTARALIALIAGFQLSIMLPIALIGTAMAWFLLRTRN